jgi:hypothetical protein
VFVPRASLREAGRLLKPFMVTVQEIERSSPSADPNKPFDTILVKAFDLTVPCEQASVTIQKKFQGGPARCK